MSTKPPGAEVIYADPSPQGALLRALATPMVVGETERGALGAQVVRSMVEYRTKYGVRTATSQAIWDHLDAHFKDGGGPVYVSRRVGPTPVKASITFLDGSSAQTLKFVMNEYGDFGNAFNAAIIAGDSGGEFKVRITHDTDTSIVETSPSYATGIAAAADTTAWSQWGTLVDVAGSALDPATAAAASLTGGTDDHGNVTTTETLAALNKFDAEFGPGNYELPANTDTATLLVAAQAAADRKRILKANTPATADVPTLLAWAATLTAGGNGDVIDAITPRVYVPGITAGGTRLVDGSVVRTAAEGRNDRAGISPNQPAAGRHGISDYATDVQFAWDDADRAALNTAGINVIRLLDGNVTVFGSRTLADGTEDPAGVRLGSARLRGAFAEIARAEGNRVAFDEITESELGALEGNVTAGIKPFQKSLTSLDVAAALVDGDDPGTSVLQTSIEFSAIGDAETTKFIISRTNKEV